MLAAAFCTAGRAYAGSTVKLLNHSKASTATGILFAAGIAASESNLTALHCCVAHNELIHNSTIVKQHKKLDLLIIKVILAHAKPPGDSCLQVLLLLYGLDLLKRGPSLW